MGCVLGWPTLCYIVRFATGRPIRQGERPFLHAWLNGQEWPHEHMRHLNCYYEPNTLCGHSALDVAKRYPNDGEPFIVLNEDHIGWATFWVGHRLRRLVDHTAARESIPVFPIPFTPWQRARPDLVGATFTLIQRRGRECAFARTIENETVYYLSGFDYNEFPPLYFLTQLPRQVVSIDDARESLKPHSVVLAEKDGRKIFRQGDMFAIVTAMTSEDIKSVGGVIEDKYTGRPLYGTAHTADLVATLPDGTQLAWGRLHHKPSIINQNRDADHRPAKLKNGCWHLVAKNTTPMRPPTPVKEV